MTDTARVARPSRAPRRGLLGSHILFLLVLAAGLAVSVSSRSVGWPDRFAAVVTAVAVYLLTTRWGVWRWLAALASAPAPFDSGLVGADRGWATVWPLVLVSAGLLAGCWRARPGPGLVAAAVAGPVLGVVIWYAADPTHLVDGWGGSPVRGGVLVVTPLLALGAAAGLGRSSLRPLRLVCLVVALVPALVLAATAPGLDLSRGDAGPLLLWWPAAGALGLTALLRGRRSHASERPQLDDIDRTAIAAFDERYATPHLSPVTVVIAAYEEASGLPAVLAGMPDRVCGLPLDVLVIDDGSSDTTADEADHSGRAFVVRCPANRGQGAALRLGYRVAREHGADYVVTTDADGQYDVGDFPAVLAPVLNDRADFVTGSRRRGHQHTQDRVRRLGVHVFAWSVSLLVGHYVTDTSFGLRAMRAEVTAAVTLNQPQYQSSELMIGAFSHRFRVLEVPGTMHPRGAGSTKKGRNLVYGRRYAGVVLGTWWREGCPFPVTEAAAVRGSRDHAVS